ncbi:ATP synthase F1 complex subunit alpha [Candidatus Xenohaliotis californiensis]|uniref:ATP synthase subunit alpha n=1 Tax=Candidatus Xenohaliotis californiensis TaxID=84677 RepID=A0ABM9N7F1_9RICK|nr:ATP synthase F1 complex subunit alpha [Candidatus Xenohaliotis californiensis]
MVLNIAEISRAIQKNMAEYEEKINFEETGHVLSIRDGVVLAYGLNNVKAGELVEFENNVKGMVLNMDANSTSIVLFSDDYAVKEGDVIKRTEKFVTVPVGMELLGRVVNPLGEPIDGLGSILTKEELPIERPAPGIIERRSVYEPLHTGTKVVDALIPIGRGQRELLVGDRKTGKTTITIDAIINQAECNKTGKINDKIFCIYVAIAQKASTIAKIVEILRKTGALEYTIVVAIPPSSPAPLQYIAPYAGCTMAEYFRDNGMHALVVYDDLSKHAVAYRQMSLLLRRPPGREAYPGDIFFVHSRLLERAAKMSDEKGGGSLTALPIVETQAGDISAYIPTNLISITDGQIFLESELFNKGIRPAVNIGMSVSRVGSAAQKKAMKKVAGTIKLDLAQAREMESFAQFASDLDVQTRTLLRRGACLVELLKQNKNTPMSPAKQVVAIFVGVQGYLDNILINLIKNFETDIIETMISSYPEILQKIDFSGDLNKEAIDTLHKVAKSIAQRYQSKSAMKEKEA